MSGSAHFTQHEIGDPPPELEAHGQRLMDALEEVRAVVEAPVAVVRGYSTVAHNAAVGGEPTSFHPLGLAADVHVIGITDAEAMRQLALAPKRLTLVRRIIQDMRPGREHIHVEARHPETDTGAPLQLEIETAAGFAVWGPA